MIPSINKDVHKRANIAYAEWLLKYDEAKRLVKERDPDGYVTGDLACAPEICVFCDCCSQGVIFSTRAFHPDTVVNWNLHRIEAGGEQYYFCSKECARILFNIHHQYAMREQAEEGRFLQDPITGTILDLDRVISAVAVDAGVKFISGQDHVVFFLTQVLKDGGDKEKQAYIEAWKKRKVRT